jgi:phage repressor protein C with HTH and peptisase S24 domain
MLRLLKIMGDSLAPEYRGGDFVLVSKIPFFFAPPSAGNVVAFRQPGYGLLIKRIQQITPDGEVYVIGTNPLSIDSREFGPIRREAILGKVIWHIRQV